MNRPDRRDSSFSDLANLGENRIHRWLIRGLLVLMVFEWLLLLLEQQWLAVFLVTLIILTLLSPIIFRNRLALELPVEFHLTAVIFIFASFYLGEIQSFYQWLWWWDIALHTSAGLLMGILGFLLVYLLNESKQADVNLTPGFISFFAFLFAVSIGTFWEIFEFGVDQLLDTNMQKPMLGDPSGLTDTMWDMIVNAVGAGVISIAGWRYLKNKRSFFVKEWIRKFINRNPKFFQK